MPLTLHFKVICKVLIDCLTLVKFQMFYFQSHIAHTVPELLTFPIHLKLVSYYKYVPSIQLFYEF